MSQEKMKGRGDSEFQRQPAHDPAADSIAQWMFLVAVVEGVEGGDRNFGFAEILSSGLLMPEAIAYPEVEKIVATDALIGWGKAAEGCELEEGR